MPPPAHPNLIGVAVNAQGIVNAPVVVPSWRAGIVIGIQPFYDGILFDHFRSGQRILEFEIAIGLAQIDVGVG